MRSSDDDSSGEETWLTPEVLELIARSTALRRGLAFVNNAPIDSVAVALGVHAHAVDRARDCLERTDARKLVLREYSRALEQRRSAPPPPLSPRNMPAPHAPDDVIQKAYEHPLGVQFLLCAPLETAAITFAVHPDVVSEARGRLAQRGVLPEE